MKLKDFYCLVQYANKAWRGFFSSDELKSMLHSFYSEYKHSIFIHQPSLIIRSLLERLEEDGTPECISWRNMILGGIENGY